MTSRGALTYRSRSGLSVSARQWRGGRLHTLAVDSQYALAAVEGASRDGLNRELGAYTVRDGCDGSGLHVDDTYEAVNVALEVTSLVDEDHLDATATVRKLAERLTRVAFDEGLGGWFLAATVSANLKVLEGDVVALMRSGKEVALGDGHHELAAAGLLTLRRSHGLEVTYAVSASGFEITGSADLLDEAIRRKERVSWKPNRTNGTSPFSSYGGMCRRTRANGACIA